MPSMTDLDLYAVLGIFETATATEIQSRYRELVRLLHPDRNPDGTSAEHFDAVTKAYEVLGDPIRRADYDALRRDRQESRLPTVPYLPYDPAVAQAPPPRMVSKPFPLQKGKHTHPQDPAIALRVGRFSAKTICGDRVTFIAQPFSVRVGRWNGSHIGLDTTVGYDAWVPSEDLVGHSGFEARLGRPTRGDDPVIWVRWVARPLDRSVDADARRPAEPPAIPTTACVECRFYRPARSFVADVWEVLSPYAGHGVFELRNRMDQMESEYQRLDATHVKKIRMMPMTGPTDLPWPGRPTDADVSYCGAQEQSARWLFAEAKNPTQKECADGLEPDVVRRSCDTCIHTRPAGDALILAVEQCISSVGFEAMQLLREVQNGLAARAELEVEAVMSMGMRGVTTSLPILLPHCAVHSAGNAYAVNAGLNPDNTCPSWEAAGERLQLMPAPQVHALNAWAAVERLRRELASRQRSSIDIPLATNIFSVSTADIAATLDVSERYDAARVAFLQQAILALGFSAGIALSVATSAQATLRQQSRFRP